MLTRVSAQGLMDIPDVSSPIAAPAERDLQLNVLINDAPMNLIGAFKQLPDGSLAVSAAELWQVGIKSPSSAVGPDGLVRLDNLQGIVYQFDEVTQSIRFTAPDEARAPRIIDARPRPDHTLLEPEASWGGLVNYTLFATSDGGFLRNLKSFRGASASLDGRIFSPYGVFSQSMIANGAATTGGPATRLDTRWTYSDAQTLVTYRAGDTIAGGLSWTRPVRLGGAQIQRNFALRPDLVTLPLPELSGSAAVPSTLEVYTQNVKTFSGSVPQGPYEVTNLPVATGAGSAMVVLRDTFGREISTSLPFYVSDQLLREGLYDFSAEIGYPRRFYGVESTNYTHRLMGSASIRYGLTNWLTLEGHSEDGPGLLNGGAGAHFLLGSFGVASFALAASRANGDLGGLFNASLETSYWGLTFYARTQRTLGDYEDIASVTAPRSAPYNASVLTLNPYVNYYSFLNARMPKILDQISIGVPFPFDRSTFNVTYTQMKNAIGDGDRIFGLSYSRNFWFNSTAFATAFKDVSNTNSFGFFAGISIPLGNDITVSVGARNGPDGWSSVAEAIKTEKQEEGSYGWYVRDMEGKVHDRLASGSYRAPFGRVQAGVEQYDSKTRMTAEIDGAIAAAGGDVFFANRIDDAFAVVDAGAPNVEVQHENRPIGKTDSRGKLLVPYLNSYQNNKISVDPRNLPVDADVPSVRQVIVPADRSGVVVKFGVSEKPRAGLINFIDANGKPLEAGSQGHMDGSGSSFVIGYDGQAYIRGLDAQNVATIEGPNGGSCRAEFGYVPKPGEQVSIGRVICR